MDEVIKILEGYGIKTYQDLNRAVEDLDLIDLSLFCGSRKEDFEEKKDDHELGRKQENP